MKKLTKKQKEAIKNFAVSFLTALLTSLTMVLQSCGVTKATISKPAEGTRTTITITTNNPMSTQVNPSVELNK